MKILALFANASTRTPGSDFLSQVRPDWRRFGLLGWSLYALLAWLLLLSLPHWLVVPELDPSWKAAMTDAAARGLRFGTEVVFTYGPLVHLGVGTYAPTLYWSSFCYQLAATAYLVALILWVGQRLPRIERAWLLAVSLPAGMLQWETLHLLAIGYIGLLLLEGWETRSGRWLGGLGLPFLVSVSLIKNTFFVFALFVLGCVLLRDALRGRWRRAVVVPTMFGALFCATWVLIGQQIRDLPRYLRGSLEIVLGYGAMGSQTSEESLYLGLAIGGWLLLQAAFLFYRSGDWRSALPAALMVAGGVLVAWKVSFTRADADHTVIYLLYAVVAVAATPAFFVIRARLRLFHWLSIGIVSCLGFHAIDGEQPRIWSKVANLLETHLRTTPAIVLRPASEKARLETAAEVNRRPFALPCVRQEVGTSSVDVFGYEQAIATLNELNYRPNPVVQGYVANTPYLSELNASFYRSAAAPEFVLFKLQPIDRRFPALDNAAALREILRRYQPVLVEQDYLLLKRRADLPATLPPADLRLRTQGTLAFGQPVPVPDGDGAFWCELDVRETLLGKLRSFFYHQPPVYLQTVRTFGQRHDWTLPPGMARVGFLVGPAMETNADFLRWWTGQVDDKVIAFKLLATAASTGLLQPTVGYRFFELPSFTATPAVGAVAESLLEAANYGEFFSPSPARIKSPLPLERFRRGEQSFLRVQAVGRVEMDLPEGATRATGKFAVAAAAFEIGHTDGINFSIELQPPEGPSIPLLSRALYPVTSVADRAVQSFDLALPPGAHGRLVLLTLSVPGGGTEWGWGGWADVKLH